MHADTVHTGRLWPSAEHSSLLQAALLDGEAAITAFQAWQSSIDLDAEFAYSTMRLLPLAYANLARLGLDDPLMERLKGVYRLEWCKNQQLFHGLKPLLAHLRASGIDLLLLKGVPLALGYYGSLALRPMADIDIAVRPEHLDHAERALLAMGWQTDPIDREEHLRYRHALWFWHPEHGELDLHYHLLVDCQGPAADQFFWSSVEPLSFLGVEALQLEPTAQLFHIIIHGLRYNEEPPIRWIPDALHVLRRRGTEIDWDRLLDVAKSESLSYRLGLGLSYLDQHFGPVLPEPVRARLKAIRPTWRERIENTVVLGDYARWYEHPIGKQWAIFAHYCRIAQTRGLLEFGLGYSHYLRYTWGLRGRRELLPVALNGLLRRLKPRRNAP